MGAVVMASVRAPSPVAPSVSATATKSATTSETAARTLTTSTAPDEVIVTFLTPPLPQYLDFRSARRTNGFELHAGIQYFIHN